MFVCTLWQNRKSRTCGSVVQALVERCERARNIRLVSKPKRAGEMYAVEAA